MRPVANAGSIDAGAIGRRPAITGEEIAARSIARGDTAMWLSWIIGFIIWVAIAFWPARVADRKGHSFFGYFLLSVLFFPLALIMAYMVSDRSQPVAV
jgi:hypothetical protein